MFFSIVKKDHPKLNLMIKLWEQNKNTGETKGKYYRNNTDGSDLYSYFSQKFENFTLYGMKNWWIRRETTINPPKSPTEI